MATLLSGAYVFVAVMGRHYAIEEWLFWRYLGYWACTLTWAGCCLLFGCTALVRLRLPRFDFLTLGFALGVFAFGLAIFLLGLVNGLSRLTFFALPLGFAACGVPGMARRWPVIWQTAASLRKLRMGPFAWCLSTLGVLGVALLYVQILTPDGFSFDTRWYHIPLAQRYALSGAIERTGEGFWMSAYPQLTSYLFTWVFLAPTALLFDRLELCVHLEFVLFLATLAQIPVLCRVLVPKLRTGLTWVTLLAFPAIYLYDSNLHAGADHVAAFFAVPIALTFWRAWHRFEPSSVLLFCVFISAAALTKYTAMVIVVPAGLALLVRASYLVVADRTRAVFLGLGTLFFAPLALTTPHWLKNYLWYGDPVYPVLHRYLTSFPWSSDAETQLGILEQVGRPGSLNRQGVLDALESTLNFSFVSNDWHELRQGLPLFGSLFTLTLPCLLFVRGTRRILWLYAGSMAAVFVWYLLSHYERFLQAALPWMAAATAATLLQIWELGWRARLALVPMLALQAIWGSDAPFIRTHNLLGDSPLRRSTLLAASGFEQTPSRFDFFGPLGTLGKATPPNAVVLAHDVIMILGIDRNWITDQHQSRISYGRLLEPAAIHQELKSLGVTHLIWTNSSLGRDSLAGDLAFLRYAVHSTTNASAASGYTVAALPREPPQKLGGDRVALFTCTGSYRRGWYELSQLTLPMLNPRRAPLPKASLGGVQEGATADFIVWEPSCNAGAPPNSFVLSSQRGSQELYVRDPRGHSTK